MGRIALCDARGLLIDAIEKLSGEDGTDWAERFKAALRKNDLLRRITEVNVSAIKKFVAADHFKIGNAGIGWLGENFKTNFLDKIEKNIKNATLVVYQLEKASPDSDIRSELGTDREETALAHLFELIEKQSKGGTGPLLTNGCANVFYIRDAKDKVWAVNADWHSVSRDWNVGAHSVEDPSRWGGGSQVFSGK